MKGYAKPGRKMLYDGRMTEAETEEQKKKKK